MQTRKKTRRNIKVPGRYFTGVGQPIDVIVRDISEGGCRIPARSTDFTLGTKVQIFIAGSGPYYGHVRWIEGGEAGINFTVPIPEEMLNQFKSCHLTVGLPTVSQGEFAPMAATPAGPPRRFC